MAKGHQSACGGLLPAPAEQTQSGKATGKERKSCGKRSYNWRDGGIVKGEPVAATDRLIERKLDDVEAVV